jgi:hypothetical protein
MLFVLQDRQASPKELAAEFNLPLANVAYHIQVLRRLKLIRLVKKTPRRGAVEHHYKADVAFVVDDNAWNATPGLVKNSMVGSAIDEVGSYVTDAAAIGGFDHADAHLTRSRLVLDQEAWTELAGRLKEVLARAEELEKESAKRLKKANHAGERRSGLVMMLFETMPGVPGADAAMQSHPKSTGAGALAAAAAKSRDGAAESSL